MVLRETRGLAPSRARSLARAALPAIPGGGRREESLEEPWSGPVLPYYRTSRQSSLASPRPLQAPRADDQAEEPGRFPQSLRIGAPARERARAAHSAPARHSEAFATVPPEARATAGSAALSGWVRASSRLQRSTANSVFARPSSVPPRAARPRCDSGPVWARRTRTRRCSGAASTSPASWTGPPTAPATPRRDSGTPGRTSAKSTRGLGANPSHGEAGAAAARDARHQRPQRPVPRLAAACGTCCSSSASRSTWPSNPGGIHFFRRAHILRDAWRRAEAFFDAHLKQGPATPTQ